MVKGVLTTDTALFLDFDGTLAPIQDDPDAVHLPDWGAETLQQLAQTLQGAMAIVSGRDVRDLAKRVPGSLFRAGNHGDLLLEPGASEVNRISEAPEALLVGTQTIVDQFPGLRVEQKARVLAIHTRGAPESEDEAAARLKELAGRVGGYHLERGKRILEMKPEGVNKGEAVRKLMDLQPFAGRAPLFLGDDTTDEDGFAAALELGGSAIKIGSGPTSAPHRLDGPDAVWTFLKEALRELT